MVHGKSVNSKFSQRSLKAQELFTEGFNCAQSVVAAWADAYGLDKDMALRLSSSFGGGMGRMRQTCGAACGLFMLAGLETGSVSGPDRAQKAANYALVQKLAAQFREEMGSLNCGELLGLSKPEGTSMPAERTPEYYKKRPCKEIVARASEIFARYLQEKK